ncbi:aquaporin AQPcic-like isoform X2 [Trichoplusia ni]|uniref:Aquaporin AQPcic-like isoform X2 n=1 Tax=Trichoplusia ni TaxID=7111 RepID=A0A7E5X4W2_TRINI|nr:aquaporin AQPcic-like isoform X2 [Trichoplusia ni]
MSPDQPDNNADSADTNMVWCQCAACGSRGQALWRVLLAEGAGAALLVLLSCLPAAAEPLHRALAAGAVVALLVQCLDHVSGAQLNPAVTLAALVWGRVSWARALCMAGAQLAGAGAGAGLLRLLRAAEAELCVTQPAPGLAPYKAALLEAVLGGCLALANCASWDVRNAGLRDSWPLRIGISVAGMSLVAGELTGASMNPVRSFGPALWAGNWTSHWVYWAGPLGGSLLATAGYVSAWRPRATHAPAKPRAQP